MNAPLLIARRDLTELVRGGRLYWMGGLLLVLLATSLGVGWQRHRESQGERARAQALDYADWLAQPERHPHDAAHQGMHVFKPEAPLSIIDPGIGPYVGSTLWLRAHRQTEVKFRPAQDATGLTRFGSLSAAWVLQTARAAARDRARVLRHLGRARARHAAADAEPRRDACARCCGARRWRSPRCSRS